MRAMTRPIVAAFLAILTLLGPAAPGQAARRSPAPLVWAPCSQDITTQCATLSVPLDWSDPYSPRIGLAVARRAALKPAARIGTDRTSATPEPEPVSGPAPK